MKTLIRRDFISWSQAGYDVRAIALVDDTNWFFEAINCMRDSDMGTRGEDGVYSRIWSGDVANIYGDDEYDYRPASPQEVDLYLAHCDIERVGCDDEKVVAIVRGRESYVLYEKKK